VPLTVAPPPRTGDAAQGPLFTDSARSAALDHAVPEPVGPVADPAHPKPAATARTVAAGVLFAVVATAIAGCLALVVTTFRLLGTNDVQLELGGPPAVLLAVAFATATVAALLFLTRNWAPPRIGTVVLAFVVSIAWPLSGVALPAALVAFLAIGLALGRDRRSGGGRRVTGWPAVGAFATAALVLAIAGAAIADTHPAPPPKAAAPAPEPVETAAPESTPIAEVTPEATPVAEATPEATPTPDATPVPESTPAAETVSPIAETESPPADTESPTVETESPPADTESPTADAELPTAESSPLAEAETPPALDPETPPASEPVPRADDAEQFVRDYYRALDEKRFEDAWNTLSPAVRKRFGGFTGWKAGYAKTLYSKPRNIAVTASGDNVTVTHLLVARDDGCSAEGRFNVTWTLSRRAEQWSVTALTASVAGANTAKCR
jgi:outer membrane biosynthesis protein TonB